VLADGNDEAVRQRYGLTPQETASAAWIVDAAGRRFAGAAAINRALRELGGLWLAPAALYDCPPLRFFENRCYPWFARNRGHFGPLYGWWKRFRR
jgi:predicted DCC family thiol-disulfide oxidoreductase YuxK